MPIPEYLKPYPVTFAEYQAARARPGIPTARAALHNAKYQHYRAALAARWAAAGGDTVDEYAARDTWTPGAGRVRLVCVSDDDSCLDDLKGDCFNPRVNSDVNPNRLAREEREFEARVASEGVHGYRAEFWDGAEWQETDAIFGFVGDDFFGSCYDDDLMESALGALAACDDAAAAALAARISAARPDLAPCYG